MENVTLQRKEAMPLPDQRCAHEVRVKNNVTRVVRLLESRFSEPFETKKAPDRCPGPMAGEGFEPTTFGL